MKITGTIGKVIVGIVFWGIVIDWVFLDGYYNPYIGEKSTTSDAEILRQINARLELERVKDAAAAKAVPIEIYATDLLQAFQRDEASALVKFKDKYVVVSGLFLSIHPNPFADGARVDIEEIDGLLDSTTTVTCEVTSAESQKLISKYGTRKDPWEMEGNSAVFNTVTLDNGSTPVKLKGRVSGQIRSEPVELVNCSLF